MILITGLTGRSGSAFYDVLCRERYPEKIRVVVRETTNRDQFRHTPLDLEFAVGDIRDSAFLDRAMEGCEMVFHIANKEIIRPLAEAAAKAPSVKNVILVSSTIVYSQYYPRLHLREDEQYCRQLFEQRRIKYLFIRPTMIFGLTSDKNISQFIRWFLKYPVFPIVKKGRASIQPVSRLDVAEAYWMVLRAFPEIEKTEYVVSGEASMSLLELFQTLCRLSGRKVRFFNVPFALAKAGVDGVWLLSGGKCDYREKLDRLTEDRAYPHDEITADLGYRPGSFEERVLPLIAQVKAEKS